MGVRGHRMSKSRRTPRIDCLGTIEGEGKLSNGSGFGDILPAMAWLWGPPCRPGNTAELMSDSKLYSISLPVLGSTLRTPGQRKTSEWEHRIV